MSDAREFHDGRSDGLVALESLDLDRVESFADLLRAMSRTAFSGRSLGEAFDVTLEMVRDPDCRVVLTLSGAMTIAKMGKVISKMIDTGMVQAVVSTGALMAHGLPEAICLTHYRHNPASPTRNCSTRATTASTTPSRWRRTSTTSRSSRPAPSTPSTRRPPSRARACAARSARCWRRTRTAPGCCAKKR